MHGCSGLKKDADVPQGVALCWVTTVTGLFVVFMIMMAMVQAEEGRCTVVCRQQYIRVSDLGHVE